MPHAAPTASAHFLRWPLLVLIAALVGCQPSADPQAGFALLPRPHPLPDISFADGEGRERTLADFRGKVVLLNVWATWCGPCRDEMPTLDRLQGELGGDAFEVIALSIDANGAQSVRGFYSRNDIARLPLFIDQSGEAANRLGVGAIPSTLLIDRDGRELGRRLGEAEWDSPEMVEFLRSVIAGEPLHES